MNEMITWLRAQLDEAEADADRVHDQDACDNAIARGRDACTCRWPDLIKADTRTKRRVLDAYADAVHLERVMDETDDDAKWDWMFKREALEGVVNLLAQSYAGRSGWREEWRAASDE